jgi:hypothetical protein
LAIRGRPTKYRKDFHPEDFIRLSEQGKTYAQIARAWKIDRDTIKEWRKIHPGFSAAVKKGRQLAEAWYMDLGQAAMVGVATLDGKKVSINLGMFVWMTKNMFKWSDQVKMVTDEDEDRPLRDLPDEELDNL